MKKLISILLLLICGLSGFSQNIKDVKAPPEVILQMGYTGNTYSYILTKTNVGTGLLSDTTAASTTLILQTVNYAFLGGGVKIGGVLYPAVAADTVYPADVDGNGEISAFGKVYKVSGTDTVVVTFVESIDGQGSWTPVPGVSVQTVYPTSLTVPLEVDFTINSSGLPIKKNARHYALQFAPKIGLVSCVAWFRDYVSQMSK